MRHSESKWINKMTIKWINLKKKFFLKPLLSFIKKRLLLLNFVVVKKVHDSTEQAFKTNIKIPNKSQVLSIYSKYFFKLIIF